VLIYEKGACGWGVEPAIREFIDAHHANPKPFPWTKPADLGPANIARYAQQRTLDFRPPGRATYAPTTRPGHQFRFSLGRGRNRENNYQTQESGGGSEQSLA